MNVNSEVENLKALTDNEFTTTKIKNFITDNMSFIDSLKEELAYLRNENINKTEIKKYFTEKNHAIIAPVILQNENPNSESNISSTNNEKISKPNFSPENEHR